MPISHVNNAMEVRFKNQWTGSCITVVPVRKFTFQYIDQSTLGFGLVPVISVPSYERPTQTFFSKKEKFMKFHPKKTIQMLIIKLGMFFHKQEKTAVECKQDYALFHVVSGPIPKLFWPLTQESLDYFFSKLHWSCWLIVYKYSHGIKMSKLLSITAVYYVVASLTITLLLSNELWIVVFGAADF